MGRVGFLLVSGLLMTALSGCVSTAPPEGVVAALDSCDRQAEICRRDGFRDPIFDEYGRPLGCEAQANRCFSRVYRDAQRNYRYTFSDSYVFYGRAGYWSPRRGWIGEPHGRPYTWDRRRYDGRPGSRDPYRYGREPYYDDPYDCYGRRRASYCYDPYYDRDRRDRDRDRDRNPPRPAPVEPPSTQPNPKGNTPVPKRPVREPDFVPRPTSPVQQAPRDQSRDRTSPPQRTEPPRSTPPRSQPAPKRSTPAAPPAQPPSRSTPTPAPPPKRAAPAPKPQPKARPRPSPNPRDNDSENTQPK
ncbi:MAG: hypothetical protein AAGA69_00680 [Pseudomonadota bacterium]